MDRNYLLTNGVYQIYPISFKDENGDGKGDLKGIISKLGYLSNIGIKTIWLSPIYASPMKDMGYDISDYEKINPLFGNMDDFDTLVSEANKQGIRIIMDLVVNHTSNQHVWFQEALKNPNSPYRNYYYFRKGKNGSYPNNWTSYFQGPAWSKVPNEDNMYYLHIFAKEQPDLNWNNEALIKEVENVMSFWMDKGVYGFRCDVISCIYKDSLDDGIVKPHNVVGMEHYVATKGGHDIIKRLRKDVIDPHHGVLIGECFGVNVTQGPQYVDEDELDTFFSFEHMTINQNTPKEFVNPSKLKKIIEKWQTKVSYNGNYLENHDQHRSISKFVRPGFERMGSKMLLTLLFSLRGVPFVYEGEEIGARDYPKGSFSIADSNDCSSRGMYDFMIKKGYSKHKAEKMARHVGRDDGRFPMAFSSKEGYGFTIGKPWQKFNPLSKEINVEDEEKDPNSTLAYFKKILALRKAEPCLCFGDIHFIKSRSNVLVFTRSYEDHSLLVLINMSNRIVDVTKKVQRMGTTTLIDNRTNPKNNIFMPYEARIERIK